MNKDNKYNLLIAYGFTRYMTGRLIGNKNVEAITKDNNTACICDVENLKVKLAGKIKVTI